MNGLEVEQIGIGGATVDCDPQATSLRWIDEGIEDEGYIAIASGE